MSKNGITRLRKACQTRRPTFYLSSVKRLLREKGARRPALPNSGKLGTLARFTNSSSACARREGSSKLDYPSPSKMELALKLVERHCLPELNAYVECVDANPRGWGAACDERKRALSACAAKQCVPSRQPSRRRSHAQ